MDCCRTSRRLGGEDVKVDRALRLRGDEGLALGEGGRDARGHPDPQLPRAQGVHPRRRPADRRRLREGRGAVRRQGPAPAGADRRAGRCTSNATTCWSRSARRTPSPGSSATSASSSTSWGMPVVDPVTMPVDLPERLLRRRCGLRPEEHHLGGGARPRGGDLDRPAAASGEDVSERPPPLVTLDQPEDGHPRVELRQRHLARPALQGAAARPDDRARRTSRPRSSSASTGSSATRRRSAASTATCRRCSPTRSASSATPASTSARWTASPSPRTAPEDELRAPAERAGAQPRRRTSTSRRRSRPGGSWSRTRTSACTAASAPSAARPAPGTCRSSCSTWRTPQEPPDATDERQRRADVRVNDFVVKFANVNGSGSASANRLFAKLDPAHGRAGRARATSSRRTSRACRPGTRCASPRPAISAGAAAST